MSICKNIKVQTALVVLLERERYVAGTIFGMANTLSSLGGFLSSLMVGSFTYNNQTYAQWRKVFGILVGTYAGGALMFLVFGSGELQSWNSGSNKLQQEDKERIPLNKKNIVINSNQENPSDREHART
uniref:Uncharacterized protein n=1 Tax=Timema genevievae TaxID=629358 RepID=A0A7R9K9J4_TIMGE|nr:unnamed protein product [Timema genevievae]